MYNRRWVKCYREWTTVMHLNTGEAGCEWYCNLTWVKCHALKWVSGIEISISQFTVILWCTYSLWVTLTSNFVHSVLWWTACKYHCLHFHAWHVFWTWSTASKWHHMYYPTTHSKPLTNRMWVIWLPFPCHTFSSHEQSVSDHDTALFSASLISSHAMDDRK